MEIDVETLPACPFCGAGETHIDARHLAPRMNGPGALICVVIRHHCDRLPGAVHAYREVRGRDMESAVAEYSRRAPGTKQVL